MNARIASIEGVQTRLLDSTRTTNETPLISDTDIGIAVDRAVSQFSKDRPRAVAVSIPGNASHYYQIGTAFIGWMRGLSEFTKINYPSYAVSANKPPQWLNRRDFTVYLDSTDTEYLYLPSHIPGTAATMRVYYTAAHTHTDETDTIYVGDVEAVRDLAASISCEMLATRFASSMDATIRADSVNYRDRQSKFSQQAKRWRELYYMHLGLPVDGGVMAASVTSEWPSERGGGVPWLFHG